jgi:hypothetical protein
VTGGQGCKRSVRPLFSSVCDKDQEARCPPPCKMLGPSINPSNNHNEQSGAQPQNQDPTGADGRVPEISEVTDAQQSPSDAGSSHRAHPSLPHISPGIMRTWAERPGAGSLGLLNTVCELVDNSRDAEATTVDIVSEQGRLFVIDNGIGLHPGKFSEASRVGNDKRRMCSSIGEYGVGLKSCTRLMDPGKDNDFMSKSLVLLYSKVQDGDGGPSKYGLCLFFRGAGQYPLIGSPPQKSWVCPVVIPLFTISTIHHSNIHQFPIFTISTIHYSTRVYQPCGGGTATSS